ncbi:MAG: hypothetical protein QXE92_03680 [Thermofilaceae archaeon]
MLQVDLSLLMLIAAAGTTATCMPLLLLLTRNKCTAIFLRKQGDAYVKVGKKRFSHRAEKIKFMDKTFLVDLKKIAYLNSTHPIIFFDYDSGDALTFSSVQSSLSADELDIFLSKQIIKQLASSASPQLFNLVFVLVVFGLGLAIGLIAGQYLPLPHAAAPASPAPANATIVPLPVPEVPP